MRNFFLALACLLLMSAASWTVGWNVSPVTPASPVTPVTPGSPDAREEQTVEGNSVRVVSAPIRLKASGQLRGSIAPRMKLDIGIIGLDAGACPRFEISAGRGEAILSLCLTDSAGKRLEGTVMGAGYVEFEGVRGGEYTLTLENLSKFNADFTIDYDSGGILL